MEPIILGIGNFQWNGLEFVHSRGNPVHRQIFRYLSTLIVSGELPAGTKLPSSRDAARQLGVGRNTVITAYDALISDGFLEARQGSGVWVTYEPVAQTIPKSSSPTGTPLSARGRVLSSFVPDISIPGEAAFHPGLPDVGRFPLATWSRLVRRHLRYGQDSLAGYHSTGGLPQLREAIAKLVNLSRGIICNSEQVIITNGAQSALDLVARMILDPGDNFWIEEPGYAGARQAMTAAGGVAVPIPVDENGWHFTQMADVALPKAIYVTPSCHWPSGLVMQRSTRNHVLDLANTHRSWVIEDDYDSEFRFHVSPAPALHSLASDDRVIHLGTFSKTMLPSLRIGYIIAPKAHAASFQNALAATGQHPSLVLQAALTDFINEGFFSTHVRKMRNLYAQRHTAFIQETKEHLPSWMQFRLAKAGMQVVADTHSDVPDQLLSQHARSVGISVTPMTPLFHQLKKRNGLIFGFAALDCDQRQKALQRLNLVL
ncbi:MAG: PLP-dependent aminotransferase family protein [Pseudoruegeria sp.]